MIDLRDGKITDLINNQMAYNPETMSIGYAILQEKQRLMALVDRTRLMAVVENLEEWVLDYLAVELRAPAYEDRFPIEVKRELIAGTLPFYAKLGTPQAINWATRTIFGGSQLKEWFEYGGKPYHFRMKVDITDDVFSLEKDQRIIKVISTVKNLRSHLDGVTYFLQSQASVRAGAAHLGCTQRLGAGVEPKSARWPEVHLNQCHGAVFLGWGGRVGGAIVNTKLTWPQGRAATGLGAGVLAIYQKINQKARGNYGTLG